MWKIILGIILIVGGIGYSGYIYFSGDAINLYNEAKELEKAGKIKEAHDKITEAIKISPTNRKIISYKTELFAIVDSESKFNEAVNSRNDAIRAMDRGDYVTASEKLKKANDLLYNVSQDSMLHEQLKKFQGQIVKKWSNMEETKVPVKLEELQEQLIKDAERLKVEVAEKYYNRAKELSSNGEYERAYRALLTISSPDEKIKGLMDELAYKIAVDKYTEVLRDKKPTEFLVRDALLWFDKLSSSSNNLADADKKKDKLNKILKEISGKNE